MIDDDLQVLLKATRKARHWDVLNIPAQRELEIQASHLAAYEYKDVVVENEDGTESSEIEWPRIYERWSTRLGIKFRWQQQVLYELLRTMKSFDQGYLFYPASVLINLPEVETDDVEEEAATQPKEPGTPDAT
jgi:hypothetical protein